MNSNVPVIESSTQKASRRMQAIIAVAGFVILFLIFALYKYLAITAAIAEHSSFAPPPEAVTTLVVSELDWPTTVVAVGSVSSPLGVTLSAEEAGTVESINVESGLMVEKGQVLVSLDTSVEEAQLRGAVARVELARQELQRYRNLRERNAVSKSDFERSEAEFRTTEAETASLAGIIARKTVVAPFAGRAGIRAVNIGQWVAAGTPIIPLYSLDPLYVNFSLPQDLVTKVAPQQAVDISFDNGLTHTLAGLVTAVNPQVEEQTRNFTIQATVNNPKEILRPGMFVRVTLTIGESKKLIAIPSSSINYAPYGDTVYIVESSTDAAGKESRTVRAQVVKLGASRGEQVAVLDGLTIGDEVVTSGVFKLQPGAAVLVNNSLAPSNEQLPSARDI